MPLLPAPVPPEVPVDAASPSSDATPQGGNLVRVLASSQVDVLGLYSDGNELFFSVQDRAASIRAVKLDGTGLRVVAPFNIDEGYNPYVGEVTEYLGKIAWTNLSGGIFLIDKAGANRIRVWDERARTPLAHDGNSLFFFSHDEYSLHELAAGTPPAMRAKPVVNPRAIAIDSENIFWSERGPLAASNGGIRTVKRNAPAGTVAESLYKDGPNWDVGGIALTATQVYFAEAAKRRVARVPKIGGPAIVVADSLPNPVSVRISGDDLFILDAGAGKSDGALYRLAIADVTAKPRQLARGLGQPLAMIVDSTDVYVACTGSGEVVAVRR